MALVAGEELVPPEPREHDRHSGLARQLRDEVVAEGETGGLVHMPDDSWQRGRHVFAREPPLPVPRSPTLRDRPRVRKLVELGPLFAEADREGVQLALHGLAHEGHHRG